MFNLIRRGARAIALAVAALIPTTALAQAPANPGGFTEIPGEREFSGRLIARPIQPADAVQRAIPEFQRLLLVTAGQREMLAIGIERHFPEVDEYLVRVPAGETEDSIAARLLATGGFSYVEPDWILFPIQSCSNDPLLSQQWHHAANRLNSCLAWSFTIGSPTVVVAICDTGILSNHQDLWQNRLEGYHVPSQKWESQGGPINDINGHGTLCTGAAAATGNNGLGIAGMGWNLRHRMLRVTDSSNGSASLSNLTLAARRAAEFGDKVASVSYSGVNSSSVFTTGTYVRSLGSLLVWAAGNSNVNLTGNREDDVIVVGATTQSDTKASFSNYGPLVDLVAPGVSIRTTASAATNAYAYVDGTSFATPIVAGLCALIWSYDPSLTPAQVEAIVRATCVDLGAAGVDNIFGYGRVNAGAALQLVANSPPPQPSVVFADGFESGNLTAGGWVVQNTNAFATTAAKLNGSWGARVRSSSWMEKSISTAGLKDIRVQYSRRTSGLLSNQWLYVEWWTGSAWQIIEQTKATSWETISVQLPASANNKSNFKLRFRVNANSTARFADIDSVEIVATPN